VTGQEMTAEFDDERPLLRAVAYRLESLIVR
jgi:hypothetical protein